MPFRFRGKKVTPEEKKKVLERLIERKLLYQEAKSRGLDEKPTIRERIKNLEETLLINELRRSVIQKGISITEDQMRKYYEEHPEIYNPPERVRARVILLDSEEKALELLNKIKRGEASFDQLARQYSLDEKTKVRGGDTGYFTRGSTDDPDFEEAVFSLKEKGEMSNVVKTSKGYYIIQLIDRIKPIKREFEKVKSDIRRRLTREIADKKQREFVEDLKKKYTIVINEALL